MILRKWNWKKSCYEAYEVPDDWEVKAFSLDMEEEINCAQCGKRISFGSSYTSREVHTDSGLGYPVCEDCHNEEIRREKQKKEKQKKEKQKKREG